MMLDCSATEVSCPDPQLTKSLTLVQLPINKIFATGRTDNKQKDRLNEIFKKKAKIDLEIKVWIGDQEGIKVETVPGTSGKRVYTSRPFEKGECVCSIQGELIGVELARKRESEYKEIENKSFFLFYFVHNNVVLW